MLSGPLVPPVAAVRPSVELTVAVVCAAPFGTVLEADFRRCASDPCNICVLCFLANVQAQVLHNTYEPRDIPGITSPVPLACTQCSFTLE